MNDPLVHVTLTENFSKIWNKCMILVAIATKNITSKTYKSSCQKLLHRFQYTLAEMFLW